MTNVGIYKMTSPSNKIYIGQSWNLKERQKRYKSTGAKNQTKLHNALLKYGFEKLDFKIIHYLPEDVSQEVLDIYETLYWQLYQNCGFKMLNIRKPGSRGKFKEESLLKMSSSKLGIKHPPERNLIKSLSQRGLRKSEETKEKIRKALTGKSRSKEFAEQCSNRLKGKAPIAALRISLENRERKVIQMSLSGEDIKIWQSATIAGNSLKIDPSSISKCCKNKLKTAGNFKWVYFDSILRDKGII